MTLPSIINNIQKKVLRNQFKKTYSVLLNGITKTSYDLGYTPACHGWLLAKNNPTCSATNAAGACIAYTTPDGSPLPSDTWGDVSECNSVFWPQFKKELKIVKECSSNALSNGCIGNLKGVDQINQESYNKQPGEEGYIEDYGSLVTVGGCGGYKKSAIDRGNAFVLADGTIIFNYTIYKMDVDVNGKKGPNKWGYDLFSLRLDREGLQPIKIVRSECGTVDKGGISATSIIQNIAN